MFTSFLETHFLHYAVRIFNAYCAMSFLPHIMLFVPKIYPAWLSKYSGFSKACAKFKYPAD
jgi:hypothetical protein